MELERLFKRAIGAGRPDAVHAYEHAELKSLGAVLFSQGSFSMSLDQ